MLGPLPTLHRWVVCVLALLACTGIGTWLGVTLPAPLLGVCGAGLGAGLGVAVVLLLLHDRGAQPRPARTRARRRTP